MYFRLQSNILFRKYDTFGYITDNRNFGYQMLQYENVYYGDRVVSESGAVFLSALSYEAEEIDLLTNKIQLYYKDLDKKQIEYDATLFYLKLEEEGFVVSGYTKDECNNKLKAGRDETEYSDIVRRNNRQIKLPYKTTQDFFEEYFHGQPLLRSLYINITNICNEDCVYCHSKAEEPYRMDKNLLLDVLKQAKDMNVLHVTLAGGEPMEHPDFLLFLQKCRAYNFSVNVLSNLTLLNEEIFEEMAKNPLLCIQTTLYSTDFGLHDAITNTKGSYEKTLTAVLKLADAGIPVQINCPVLRQNQNEYEAVVQWGKQHNIHVECSYLIFHPFEENSGSLEAVPKVNSNYLLSMEDWGLLVKKRMQGDEKFYNLVDDMVMTKYEESMEEPICNVGKFSLCISENGDVLPCVGFNKCTLGNIKQTNLKDLWEQNTTLNDLRGLKKKDFQSCLGCPSRLYCTMCMVHNEELFKTNPYMCKIVKAMKEAHLEKATENMSLILINF